MTALLDPVSSLAFEMHASKGMFALLLGSGISRTAKIPTGWEITLELVRRVAALRGTDTNGDPATWYRAQAAEEPDYSKLLDALATTPTQRQQLIQPFIEPDEAEIARGEKRPTAAHRAIAQLMGRGYVRVVITTNFDRLLEQALAEIGLHASVLSSEDQIAGAMPLVHAGPTIIKVHGDYLDTRIKNTTSELSAYGPQLDGLLDRVFDEYGLVVCGWSADWDVALKAAIDRAPSRRFPMYWASRGAPSASADALISRRAGRLIQIVGADDFFGELEDKVSAIERISRPHPLSAELAVAMLKEYVPEPKHRVRLHDLLIAERNRTLNALATQVFETNHWDPPVFADQTNRYESSIGTLVHLSYHSGMWCDRQQARFWVETMVQLATRGRSTGGITVLVDLMAYPAMLVLYAYLLGAVVGHKTDEFGFLSTHQVDFGGTYGRLALGDRLNASALISDGGQGRFKCIPSQSDKKLPASEQVAGVLRPVSRHELVTDLMFDEAFARVELALSLGFAERRSAGRTGDDFWSPLGRFAYQGEIKSRIMEEWKSEYESGGATSRVSVMAGLRAAPRFEELNRLASRFGLFG